MKTTIRICILFSLIWQSVSGQTNVGYLTGEYWYYDYFPLKTIDSSVIRNNIRTIINCEYSRKNKLLSEETEDYNQEGRITRSYYCNKSNMRSFLTIYTDTLVLYIQYDKDSNIIWKTSQHYFNNILQGYVTADGNGKIISTFTTEFNEAGNKTEEKYAHAKKRFSYVRKWNYYENGEKKEELYYNHKGKLVRRYSYDCSPVPDHVKNLKDTVLTCHETGYDADSNIIDIHTTVQGKIKIRKTVYIRNRNHPGEMIGWIVYGNEGLMTDSIRYWNDSTKHWTGVEGRPVLTECTYFTRNEKGLIITEDKKIFNKAGKLTGHTICRRDWLNDNYYNTSCSNNEKKGYSTITKVNDKGLRTEFTEIWKGKQIRRSEFKYIYR